MKKSALRKLIGYNPTQDSSKLVKIGQASQLLGVSIDTLRRWEKKGWLKAIKTPGGTRLYDKEQLVKLNPNLKRGPKTLISPLLQNVIPANAGIQANQSSWIPGQARNDNLTQIHSSTPISLSSDHSVLKTVTSLWPEHIEKEIEKEDEINLDTNNLLSDLSGSFKNLKTAFVGGVLTLLIILALIIPGLLISNYIKTIQTPSLISVKYNNIPLSDSANILQKLSGIFSPTLSHKLFSLYQAGGFTLSDDKGPPGIQTNKNIKVPDNLAARRGSDDLKGVDFSRIAGEVLAESSPSGSFLQINLDTELNGSLAVDGEGFFTGNVTAPNLLYGITAGDNISITGDTQNPTISTTGSNDTLQTVTARGAVTTIASTFSGGLTASSLSLTGTLNLGQLSSDPSSAVNGATYYNTGSNKFKCYVNGSWSNCDTDTTGGDGDITGVTAGNGLTGGGSSGAVTLTVDATTTSTTTTTSSNSGLEVSSDGIRLLGGCTNSQGLIWNSASTIWECGTSGSFNSFSLAGDSGTTQTITDSNTVTLTGGTNGIDTVAGATDTITLNLDTTEIGTTTFGSGSGFTWTFDAGSTDPTIALASDQITFGAATAALSGTTTLTASSLSTLTTAASLSATSTTTLTLGTAATINSNGTDLNLQADGAIDVDVVGGSGATGCTFANSTGNLTCSGTITGGGTVGFWSRSGTTLSPATANDIVSIPTTNTTGADLAITNTGVYTGTGIFNLTANSATSGTLATIAANGLTTGTALAIASSSTAGSGSGNSFLLDLSRSGANSNATHTAYGIRSQVTNTGTTSSNIAGYFSASGGTNNYALITNAGNIVFNDSGSDSDLSVEADNNANLLVLDGGLFSGVGQLSIGSAAQGTPTAFAIFDNPAITATSNQNFYKTFIDNSAAITVTGATTSPLVASLAIDEPNITATGTVTNAASLYISAAPTEGASGNFALWVDNGESRFENTPVSGSTTGSALTVVPSYVVEAADLTLSGVRVALDTNSNADSGDIAYGVNIDDISSTAGPTEYGLRVGSGYDYQMYFELGARDLRLSATTPSAGTSPLTLTIPALGADDNFCLVTLGNCFGGGSSGVTYTSQTTNAITKFTSTAGQITSSSLIDDGTTLTLAANVGFVMTAGTGSITQNFSPSGNTGTARGTTITPTFGIDATDQTLTGLYINPNTNSNLDSGDTLYGALIDTITASSATEYGVAIGSGYDTNLLFNDTSTRVAVADGGAVVILDTAGNTLCTVTDAGTTGNLTCTGNIGGGSSGTVGFWTRTGTTLTPATSNDVVSVPTTNTTGADLAITNTGVYTGTGIFNLTANSATTGTVAAISTTGMTTGEILDLTGTWAPADGTTNEAIDLNITHTPTSSADNFSSINLTTTDGTALGNTVYGLNNTLTLTGDAAKTGYGVYSTTTSSSITADTLYGGNFAVSTTGATTTGTRTSYGVYSSATTANVAGGNTVVHGVYALADGTVASGGINANAIYAANGTMNATGASRNVGLYIEPRTGADNNFGICFDCDGTWSSSSVASGIQFGNDANGVTLYRSASDNLRTDDALTIGSTDNLQIASTGDITFVDADGAATITGPDGGALGIAAANSQALNLTTTTAGNISLDPAGAGDINLVAANASGSFLNIAGLASGTSANALCQDSSANVITCASGGVVDGSAAANQVTYWSDADTITGSANFTITPAATTGSALTLANNSLTSGTQFALSGTGITTGEVLDITSTHAPTDGSDNEAIDINLTFTPTSSAATFRGLDLNVTEGSNTLTNTIYGHYGTTALTGNAAKSGYGIYQTVTSASTTGDTLIAFDAATSSTGIIGTGTKTVYGVRSQPASTGASTAGTHSMYGIYSAPSSTLANGSTENVYGIYSKATGTVAAGTVNSYGVYIANPTLNTTGTSAKFGLFLEDLATTGPADTNYGICFDCDGTYSSSTATNGITWGSDANSVTLYRSASDTLKTDDSLVVDGGTLSTGAATFNLLNATATTINFGGGATTALNIGNGASAYTAINIGSGAGGNTINLAGTGATGADTINIGTGGTAADTITIGNSASTTSLAFTAGTGNITFTNTQPASVGTTPGTAATTLITTSFSTGGNTTIATTGTGGIGSGLAWTLGTGGTAASANTASTGGAGGAYGITSGTGGASTAATGTNVGGAGGAVSLTGGTGGAASGGSSNTGGAGGAVTILAGSAGSGGNANGGTLTLNSGAITGSGTSTLNLGSANATTVNLATATSATTLNIGAASTTAVTMALAGGSGDTGCTLAGATGNFTCSGNITGSSSGTVGFWTRTSTTLSPATANDIVSIANTNTTGADLAITNTGIYTGTGIFNLTANSATSGDLATISGTALTSGSLLTLTGPSGGTAGVTDAALKIASDVGNIGTSNGLISSTATIDSTADAISGVNLYLSTVSSQALATTVGQTYYGIYNNLAKTGADTTSGTITSYGTYSTASNTGGDTAGTRNTYGGYFSATGDGSGTTSAIGIYASAASADNNYALIVPSTGGRLGIGTTTPTADYLSQFVADSTNDWARVIDITQANDATEDSNVIDITNTVSPGAGSRTIKNINLILTPTAPLTASATGSYYGIFNSLSLANTSVSTGTNTIEAVANNSELTSSPTFNSALGTDAINSYSSRSVISGSPTLTQVTGGTTYVNYGHYITNSVSSAGDANLTATSYGISANVSGDLTTTGTTTHYGGYFSTSGTADTNYGLYVTASGATTNYAAVLGDGTDQLQIASTGDITFVDANDGASITGPAGGALTVAAGAAQALTLTGNLGSTWSTSNGLLTISGDDGLTLTAASTAGIVLNTVDAIANAFDLQQGSDNYINVNTSNGTENISFGNATTNPTFSFLGTSAVTIAGSGDGTDALVLTVGDLTITNGDFDLVAGDFNVNLDAADTANFSGTAPSSVAGNGTDAGTNTLLVTGTVGGASSGTTGQTGGTGGAVSLTGGIGGAVAGASGIGGVGGAATFAGGAGGNGAATGGAGGAVSITAGAAGTGGNANGGTLTLNSGAITGSGTSTLNLASANATTVNLATATSATTLNIGAASTTAVTMALAGGSGDTGCTLAGATGNFVCTGTVTGSNGALASTLQNAYDNDGDTGDTIIALTTSDDSLIFRNPAASGSDSSFLLQLDQLSTGSVDALAINQASTNSGASAIQITSAIAHTSDLITFDNTGDAAWTGNILDFTTGTGNATGNLIDLTIEDSANDDVQAIVINAAGALDQTGWALELNATGAFTANAIDINTTAASSGNIIDITTATAATSGNLVDLNFGNIADTGDAINISMGAAAVGAQGLVMTTSAGIRTASAIQITENNTSGAVPTIQWDSAETRGGLLDANLTGALVTENFIDITTSAAWTSNLFSITSGAQAATGNYFDINIGNAAQTGDVFNTDITAGAVALQYEVVTNAAISSTAGWLTNVTTSAAWTGNAVDFTTGAQAWTGNVLDFNFGNAAATGDVININNPALAVATQALVLDNAAASTTAGWALDINASGAWTNTALDFTQTAGISTGDVLAYDNSGDTATTGDFISFRSGTGDADGDVMDITVEAGATSTQIFDVNNAAASDEAGWLLEVDTTGVFTGNMIDIALGAVAATGEVINIDTGATAVNSQALVITTGSAARTASAIRVNDQNTTGTVATFDIDGTGTRGGLFDIDWSAALATENLIDVTANSIATANLVTLTANGLTTGSAFEVTSTSSVFAGTATTGDGLLANFDWNPGSASTTGTGDLFRIRIDDNGTLTSGSLFNIVDESSSIFSVKETAFETSLPSNFTAAGDVAIAYDINFTNPTASYIKSAAPLYMVAGETFNSSDLTLQTYNTGAINLVVAASGTINLAPDPVASTINIAGSTNTAANTINIGTGTGINTVNVGTGTAADVINIGTGATGADVISIGTGNQGSSVIFFPRTGTPASFGTNGMFAMGQNGNVATGGRIWIRANNTNYRYNAGGTALDYSEYMKQEGTSEAGDVMIIADNKYQTVKKSNQQYDQQVLGVITKHGTGYDDACEDNFITTDCTQEDHSDYANVGMLGQVYAKITNENGTIESGDALTTSSVPGVAMKATKAGRILGFALDQFDGTQSGKATFNDPIYPVQNTTSGNGQPVKVGKVMIMLQAGWYDPDAPPAMVADAQMNESQPGDQYTPPVYSLTDLDTGNPIISEMVQSKGLIANLTSGHINAKSLSVNNQAGSVFNVDTKGNVVLGASNLTPASTDGFGYISSLDGLPTAAPTSIDGHTAITYDKVNNQICAYNAGWNCIGASDNDAAAALSLDQNGALVVADLKATKITVASDVIIGGIASAAGFALDASTINQTGALATLPVNAEGKVTIADVINALSNQQSAISQQVLGIDERITNNEQRTASDSAALAEIEQLSNQAIEQSQSLDEKVASTSGKLTSLSNQISDLLASLSDSKEASDSSAASDSFDSSNLTPSDLLIATDSATLANINITDKVSTINLSALDATVSATFKSLGETFLGTTTIAGDLSVDGTLSFTEGSKINALPILYFQTSPLAQAADFFNGTVTINKEGLVAAQSLALGQESLGEAIIPAGQIEITIPTSLIAQTSRIFLTPSTPLLGNLYISLKTTGQSFKVRLSEPNFDPVKFNWFIIQEKQASN